MPHPLLQPTDVVELDSIFYTAVECVLRGRYTTDFDGAVALGGLIAQATHGDYNPSNPAINEATRGRFISTEHLNSAHTAEFLSEELNSRHAALIGTPAADAKIKLLTIYSKWTWAEASFFVVQQPKKSPSDFIFAVTHDRILFLDTSDMIILEEHEFDVISTWGFTSASFNVKVGSLMKPINMIFDTVKGEEICAVLKSRVDAYKHAKYKYSLASGNNSEQSEIMKALGRDNNPPMGPPSPVNAPVMAPDLAIPAGITKKPVIPNLHLARAMMLGGD
jgi:hypothetical protein